MGATPTSPFFSMPFGTFTDGGYFAGIIMLGGDLYAIIVAPRPDGQSGLIQFRTSSAFNPLASRTLNDGAAATASMTSTTYPACRFCDLLTINGFSDWYMPARDELELCYRNLKPTTTANSTGVKLTSALVYTEFDDVSGDVQGINRHSFPTGTAYTSGVPAQTTDPLFQSGGAQAFLTDRHYWSSTDYSDIDVWRINFGDGIAARVSKTASVLRARAVRRVAI